jgi:hypothetical protein
VASVVLEPLFLAWFLRVVTKGWEAFYSKEVRSDMWFLIKERAIKYLV